MSVKSGHSRSHGELLSEQIAKDISKEADQRPGEGEDAPQEPVNSRRISLFSRMRLDWNSDDRMVIQAAKIAVDQRLLVRFEGAYALLNDVFDMVRTPLLDENDEPQRDRFGFVLWAKTPTGAYDEDFTRLTRNQKENVLFRLTTSIFEWEQHAADAWGEAMFAKAIWEDRFAVGFDSAFQGRVADRENAGNLAAREERYFAIFMALFSRKADSLIRSMVLLGQRVKDSLG